MICPECGYPHATPPKCRACGAEITEEELIAPPVVEAAEEEPMAEEEPSEEEEAEEEEPTEEE